MSGGSFCGAFAEASALVVDQVEGFPRSALRRLLQKSNDILRKSNEIEGNDRKHEGIQRKVTKSERNTKGIQILCVLIRIKHTLVTSIQRGGFRVLYSMRIGPSGPRVHGTQFESVRYKTKKRLLTIKEQCLPLAAS